MAQKTLRIGIYAGVFDPVHAGHISFALQALHSGQLDQVVFVPERQPRHKPGAAHYAHRVVMIAQAIRPHPDLAVLETVERRLSVVRTLPQLQAIFGGAELVFLFGSDAALHLPQWPYANRLLLASELLIGVRSDTTVKAVWQEIAAWETRPKQLRVIDSYAADVRSGQIRQALRLSQTTAGLLESVRRYARSEWLYVSVHGKSGTG